MSRLGPRPTFFDVYLGPDGAAVSVLCCFVSYTCFCTLFSFYDRTTLILATVRFQRSLSPPSFFAFALLDALDFLCSLSLPRA